MSMYPFALLALSDVPFGKFLASGRYINKALSTYPSDKNNDDLHFKRVLQHFLALLMYPFGVKEKSLLVMHPLIGFPHSYTLRANFSLVHCFYAGLAGRSPGLRRASARSGLQGCISKDAVWGHFLKGTSLRTPKALVDVPFRFCWVRFSRNFGGQKTGSKTTFLSLEMQFGGHVTGS